MKRSKKGSISIFLVIVLPIVLLSVLSIYLFFRTNQEKMSIQKVSYATSEAYLSKINSYLVDNFGLLATLDEGNLEQMVRYYFKENGLVNNPEEMNLTVEYHVLSDAETFKASIYEAARISVAQEVVNYSLGIFEQTQSFEWLKQQFNKIADLEIALSEAVEMMEMSQYLDLMSRAEDVEDFKALVSSAYARLYARSDAFYQIYETAKSEVIALRASFSTQDHQSIEMIDSKQAEWADIEAKFIKTSESIESVLDEALDLIDNHEALVATDEEHTSGLDVAKSMIIELLATQEMQTQRAPMGLLDGIRDKLKYLEEAFTGVSIESSILDFGDVGQFSPVIESLVNSSLIERALINEYFFSVFSSYDSNCPRKISVNRRNESKRRVVGEIEFLITGKTEEIKSMKEIKFALFGFRFVSNLVSYLSDKEKHIQTAQATMVFPPPWKAVAYTALVTLWCSAESYSDVNALLKGKGLMMIKPGSQWTVSLNQLLNHSMTDLINRGANDSVEDKGWDKIYYMDYLRVLMLLESETEVLSRSMDLINLEIHALSNGDYGLKDFSNGHRIILSFRTGYTYDFRNWVSR